MDDDADLAAMRPSAPRTLRWIAVGAAALSLATGAATAIHSFASGRRPSAHVARSYVPPFGLRRDAVARIDLARVHAELFPRWVLAESDEPASPLARTKLAELRSEVAKDPNLDAILTALAQATAQTPGEDREAAFLGLVDDWNHYLDATGAPWRLEPTVRAVKHRQTLYVKSYRVVSDVRAQVGAASCRARFLRREDHLNVLEPYLGHTTSREEGAFIVVDRLRELGESQVWPLLDEANDPLLPKPQLPFAESVRAEASQALSAEAFRALHATSSARFTLVKLARDIDARSECGSELHVGDPPLAGYSSATLALARAALSAPEGACAGVTEDELSALVLASTTLADERALPGALEALTQWLGRAVATHELRHVADGGLDGFSTPCPTCPWSLGPAARVELSAYVTTLATSGVAYVSLYQACTGAQVGASRAAVDLLASSLLPGGCDAAPPHDLVARAEAAEARWFSRREPVVWQGAPLDGSDGRLGSTGAQ